MKRILLAMLLLTAAQSAHADLSPAEKNMLDRIGRDPALKAQALARLSKTPATERRAKVGPGASVTRGAMAQASASATEATAHPDQQSKCAGFQILLRQDWKDFDLLKCPGAAEDATGAQVSYTNDIASGNHVWAIDGTAAVVFNSLMTPDLWWQPTYLNFGAYGTLDRSFNSATKFTASDVDKVGYGAFLQVGYLSDYLQSFVRLRGNVAENRIKNTTAANVIAEYIPVYDPLYIHYPIGPIFGPYALRFDPSLFVQYSEVTGTGQILPVNDRTEALRIGMQATLRLLPYLAAGPLARVRAAVTYRWATETYTGRNLSWLQSEMTYNLDPEGHIAVGITYKRGDDEDTGAFTNVYKAGLTGKL